VREIERAVSAHRGRGQAGGGFTDVNDREPNRGEYSTGERRPVINGCRRRPGWWSSQADRPAVTAEGLTKVATFAAGS
jgi:hypothetical protein